ncbi:MAG: hypothetical protein P0111_15195 [Nitrospira sp.]|nr:hypothetical protein [Nitrospira sp.]
MSNATPPPSGTSPVLFELPERLCTWCKIAMKKRVVGGGQFVHYTCPKCIFQHTSRLGPKPQAPAKH